ncbi:hypothetical protein [Ferrovibrio sp.]|uniref:hypothetical protein n=1 Tax=Ferrovibrio sp. TaxID=1917215 RepID=UPI003511658A
MLGWLASRAADGIARTLLGKFCLWAILVVAADLGITTANIAGWLSNPVTRIIVELLIAGVITLTIAWLLSRFRNPGDWSARDAVRYIAFDSAWGWWKYATSGEWWLVHMQAVMEFDKAAMNGDIEPRGLFMGGNEITKPTKDFWRLNKLDSVFVLEPDAPDGGRTEPRDILSAPQPILNRVIVPVGQVRKTWGAASKPFQWICGLIALCVRKYQHIRMTQN